MPRYREYTCQGWTDNPNLWRVERENGTIAVVFEKAGFVIWQMTDKDQSDDEAIQEAIISTLVEDWEGERDA